MNKSIIAFRKQKLVCPNHYQDNKNFVATANAELMRFGYMLSNHAFDMLAAADPSYIKEWITDISTHLTHIMGDGTWKPLHAGFPETVMESSIEKLYMTALLHYWTAGEYYPKQEVKDAGYEYEYTEYKMIDYIDEEGFMKIFTSLVQVNQKITTSDMKTIKWFVQTYDEKQIDLVMPPIIPFKENLTTLAGEGIKVPVKTPTDILRIANYLSGNKTDLVVPDKTIRESQWSRVRIPNPEYEAYKFGPFNRPQRKYLLSILENCAYISEMATRIEAWKRFGEVIHPGDYKKDYPRALNAFTVIRRERPKTWKSAVYFSFKRSFDVGIAKLSERPGEFARLLDSLLRRGVGKEHPERVLNPFRKCASKVSNKVLFELYEWFKGRTKDKPRTVWIKGDRAPTVLKDVPVLNQSVIDEIIDTIWGVFSDKFSMLKPLGATWLDDQLKMIPAPTNMDTTNDSLLTVVRGTRTPLIVEKKIMRFYVHWTQGDDLDISMEFCNKDGSGRATCSYHNMRPLKGVHHSGDLIPYQVGNHAEYIDLEMDVVNRDYALMVVHTFRGSGGLKAANSCVGFMERDTPTSGHYTWRPASVTNAIRITNDDTSAAFFLIDIRKKEWIWIDEGLHSNLPISIGNAIAFFVKRMAELPEVSAYDILKLHAEARGHIVNDPENAETLFKVEDFNTSYEKVLSYML